MHVDFIDMFMSLGTIKHFFYIFDVQIGGRNDLNCIKMQWL